MLSTETKMSNSGWGTCGGVSEKCAQGHGLIPGTSPKFTSCFQLENGGGEIEAKEVSKEEILLKLTNLEEKWECASREAGPLAQRPRTRQHTLAVRQPANALL